MEKKDSILIPLITNKKTKINCNQNNNSMVVSASHIIILFSGESLVFEERKSWVKMHENDVFNFSLHSH